MYSLKRESSPFFISESSPDSSYYDDPNPTLETDSNDQLANKITTLAGHINAANYRFLKLIAEFDRRKAWEGPGIRSCAYWLHWQCGIAMNAAREKVRVAKSLEGLPKINRHFEKGQLSFSKVRAMTRVATAENESYLVNIAEHGTTHHIEILSRAFRTVTHTDTRADNSIDEIDAISEQAQNEQNTREVSYYQDDEGMWVIKARLPFEEGSLLVKALTELGDRIAAKQDNTPNNGAKNVSAETFSGYKQPDKQPELSRASFG